MFLFGWHSWRGKSGRRYRFKITLTKKGLPKNDQGGIYMFVRRRFVFLLEPVYVGKAVNTRSRLLGHEKWGRAYWYYGVTERHFYGPILDEAERRRVETDLIEALKPRMNDVSIPKPQTAKKSARVTRPAAAAA